VPIKLTKGQRDRSFEQQRFESDTAKLPEGKPLQDRVVEQNQQVMQNFDAFVDETGAQAYGLRAAGKVVTDALVNKMNKAKTEVRAAYNAARDAGDMNESVDITPLTDFINQNQSSMKNAPILSAIRDEVKRLGKTEAPAYDTMKTGMQPPSTSITINNLEDLRQMINRLKEPGTPNDAFGIQAKNIIDAATEGKGGVLYQQARRMYENYANDFKNTGVIDKMLSTKPGTKDRAVAYEDVFKHSILNGSLDDVRAVRKVLQTAGPEGSQAWKELQGQTVNHIKETMFSNGGANIAGDTVGSQARLARLVRELDDDGKLQFIFGKDGAQKVRDMNELAKDLYTQPTGTVQSSNNGTAINKILATLARGGGASKVPGVGWAVEGVAKKIESRALTKKVNDALNPEQP
jgi:hypothetical protein